MKNFFNNIYFIYSNFLSKIRSLETASLLFNKYSFFNINGFIFFVFVIYKFYSGLKFDIGLLSLIISFLISFLLSSFVLNKFEFSNNIIIRYLQKFVFINICIIAFFLFALYFFPHLFTPVYCSSEDGMSSELKKTSESSSNHTSKGKDVVVVTESSSTNNKEYYEFKLRKDVVHKGISTVSEATKTAADSVIPNIGAGTADGATAAAVVKATNLNKNLELSSGIKNTKSDKTDPDQIPSPDDTNFSINSPLDEADIPLLGLINSILNLNIIELIIIIFILFIKYQDKIKKIFLNKIIFYINNNIPALKKAKYVRVSHFLNSLLIVNSRFNKIIIVYFIILLILIKILNIYFLYNLNLGIDDFVLVYNYIKKGFS